MAAVVSTAAMAVKIRVTKHLAALGLVRQAIISIKSLKAVLVKNVLVDAKLALRLLSVMIVLMASGVHNVQLTAISTVSYPRVIR